MLYQKSSTYKIYITCALVQYPQILVTGIVSLIQCLEEPVQRNYSVDDALYWAPEHDIKKIYQQLASKKYKEIPREQIQ